MSLGGVPSSTIERKDKAKDNFIVYQVKGDKREEIDRRVLENKSLRIWSEDFEYLASLEKTNQVWTSKTNKTYKFELILNYCLPLHLFVFQEQSTPVKTTNTNQIKAEKTFETSNRIDQGTRLHNTLYITSLVSSHHGST